VDANYIFTGGQTVVSSSVNGPYYLQGSTKTTTAINIRTYTYVSTNQDNTDVYVAFFR
jgi:hypothetical protein